MDWCELLLVQAETWTDQKSQIFTFWVWQIFKICQKVKI